MSLIAKHPVRFQGRTRRFELHVEQQAASRQFFHRTGVFGNSHISQNLSSQAYVDFESDLPLVLFVRLNAVVTVLSIWIRKKAMSHW